MLDTEDSIRSPGLGITMVVSYHMDDGNRTQVLGKSSQVLLTAEPTLQPRFSFFFFFYMFECFAHMYIYHMCIWCHGRPEESTGSPGTGVTVVNHLVGVL